VAGRQTIFVQQPAAGTPGIGIAGFVLSILGFSIIGLVLSWVGYAQAKREGRPSGLCLAGIIIGAVWLLACIIFYAAIFSALSAI
jgi:multisubunit Na+/H+ antiporter MnhB subunit